MWKLSQDHLPRSPLSFLAPSHPSHSIADEQTFSWHPPNPDGPTDPDSEATFYFDVGELVRLRVESEEWHDHAPTGPTQSLKAKERLQQQRELDRRGGNRRGGRNADVGAGLVDLADEADRRAPYIVIVSFFFFFSPVITKLLDFQPSSPRLDIQSSG